MSPFRKDIANDVPLRGLGQPHDILLIKKRGHTARTVYMTPRVSGHSRKSIPRMTIKKEFEDIQRGLQLTESLPKVTNTVFNEFQDGHLENAVADRASLKAEHDTIAEQTDTLLRCLVDATNDAVISAYETQI